MTDSGEPGSIERDGDGHASGGGDESARLERIAARGPLGAFAVAGVATAVVVALYFAFYVFVYLPRGVVQ